MKKMSSVIDKQISCTNRNESLFILLQLTTTFSTSDMNLKKKKHKYLLFFYFHWIDEIKPCNFDIKVIKIKVSKFNKNSVFSFATAGVDFFGASCFDE